MPVYESFDDSASSERVQRRKSVSRETKVAEMMGTDNHLSVREILINLFRYL